MDKKGLKRLEKIEVKAGKQFDAIRDALDELEEVYADILSEIETLSESES